MRKSYKLPIYYRCTVSPLSHAHVNVLGRYAFELDASVVEGGLRPLRNPDEMVDE